MHQKLKAICRRSANQIPYGKYLLAGLSFICFLPVFRVEVAAFIFTRLLIHECGHAFAAMQCRVPVQGIYLYPTWCGECFYKKSLRIGTPTEMYITAMGPVSGILFGALLFTIALLTGSNVLYASAMFGAISELSNLIIGSDGRKIRFGIRTPNTGKVGMFSLILSVAIVTGVPIVGCSLNSGILLEPDAFLSSDLSAAIQTVTEPLRRL